MAKKNLEIDAALTILCQLAEYGETLSVGAIAEVCNCSNGLIHSIERRALKKLFMQLYQTDLADYFYPESAGAFVKEMPVIHDDAPDYLD